MSTRVLVVEDESIVARDIGNMLLGLGYEVVSIVSTAKESVLTARTARPDIVLMDILLHGERTGVEAAGQIYKQLNIPVVYLTAYADEITLQRAKKTEPFGYLLKPFEERELQTTIEIALYKFKMDSKLKARERLFSTILRSIDDAVIATDQEGMITFMNPLAETLTRWEQTQALGKPANDFFDIRSEKTGEKYEIPVGKILAGKRMKHKNEAVLISKKGEEIPIEHIITPIKEESGKINGIVLTFTNISRRKKAEEELFKSFEKQKLVMEGTVQAMAFTIEARDPYTAGHQIRVTKLACAIAEEMHFSKDKIDAVRLAGSLHDIGKIYVPAEILSKPGKISEVEQNIIKTHSQVGHDILKSIEFAWPIAKIVLQHHERMDGSGYPSGLKGKDILIEARILAVADVVEAMCTHRPYRAALTIEAALDEISMNKGKLYDVKVVDACLRLFNDKAFKFD